MRSRSACGCCPAPAKEGAQLASLVLQEPSPAGPPSWNNGAGALGTAPRPDEVDQDWPADTTAAAPCARGEHLRRCARHRRVGQLPIELFRGPACQLVPDGADGLDRLDRLAAQLGDLIKDERQNENHTEKEHHEGHGPGRKLHVPRVFLRAAPSSLRVLAASASPPLIASSEQGQPYRNGHCGDGSWRGWAVTTIEQWVTRSATTGSDASLGGRSAAQLRPLRGDLHPVRGGEPHRVRPAQAQGDATAAL
ncbi:hypothetical protein QF030_000014 [Streptomyces rishiriensis]|uniref:Uncharacterized protein n=1 Tax=Streptomyces rishiriensis TaxID=68264 RepID=A0ABU0NFF5_STRRH|nr:hypothetical protein [Streptomyces rishiriensis]